MVKTEPPKKKALSIYSQQLFEKKKLKTMQ